MTAATRTPAPPTAATAASPVVLDLGAARLAREAGARLRASERSLVVAVSCFAVLPPGCDLGASPEVEVLDAADLVTDPGRLGEIARALVARAEAAKGGAADAG